MLPVRRLALSEAPSDPVLVCTSSFLNGSVSCAQRLYCAEGDIQEALSQRMSSVGHVVGLLPGTEQCVADDVFMA